MKKEYSKPIIKKIELKPEEAVLAGCKLLRTCLGLRRPFECDFEPTRRPGS